MSTRSSWVLLVGAACETFVAAIGFQSAARAEGETDSDTLEQIVVTAEKRVERLQDVPISITALGAATLTAQRIETTQDLQLLQPSLVYTSIAGFAQPYLRGIGNDFTSPNVDASVATYVDGIYISNTSAAIQSLLGTERVEVVSGPQGTLYGRNAVAGAINIYTLTPKQQFEAQASATFGNYARQEFSGYISGPVTSTLSVGLYAAFTQRNTYNDLIQVGNLAGQPDKTWGDGFRIKAVFTPTDYIKLTGSWELTSYQSTEGSAFRQIQSNATGFAFGAPLIIQDWTVAGNNAFYSNTRSNSATLREEVDCGTFRFLGISGYRYSTSRTQNDFDGTLAPIGNPGADPIFSRQFSQELQLLSEADATYQWIAGLYYFNEKTGVTPNITYSPLFFSPLGADAENIYASVNLNSYSAFAQGTIPLAFASPDLALTLGGRYTRDTKRFDAYSEFVNTEGSDTLYTGTVVLRQDYPTMARTWSQFTPKATLDFKLGSTLLYASYGKGFKAGAYNLLNPNSAGPVNPEKLTAYEIGSKSDFLNGAVRFDTAVYHYQIKDLQVQTVNFVEGTSGGGTTVLQNAGSASATGVEITAAAKVAGSLTFNVAGAYEHSEYGYFPNYAGFVPAPVGNVQEAVNVTGNSLQRAPDWVGSASVDYDKEVAGGAVHAVLGLYYNGGFSFDAAHFTHQSEYKLVNASVAYTFPGHAVTVSAWGTNLFNQYYSTGQLPLPYGTVAIDGAPRMFGGTVNWKF